jgi:hypothetical protein
VFKNRMLRRIFGPKRDEVMGGWRKLHNRELHDLYSSPSIIRIIKSRRMMGVVACGVNRKKKNVYVIHALQLHIPANRIHFCRR